MAVRSTAVLALSTSSDRVVLTLPRSVAAVESHSCARRRPWSSRCNLAGRMTPEPAVACVNPVFRPKRYPAGILSVRSLFAATLVTLAVVAALRPQRTHVCGGPSKVDVARLTVKKYAFEAFPQWAMDHPTGRCVKGLRELDRYMGDGDRVDPWGHRYAFTCGERGMFVVSLGPDGKAATADDLWSHE